jgi:inositol transport system substrate-binding protein
MKRNIIYCTLILILMCTLSGCITKREEMVPEVNPNVKTGDLVQNSLNMEKKIRIGMSITNYSPHSELASKYAVAAAEKIGVELTILNGQASGEKQISQVESFISQKLDAIIINPVSYEGFRPAVDTAKEVGIPIVTMISTVENQEKCAAFIGSNHTEAGIIQAKMLVNDFNGSAGVVILEGVMGIDAQFQRMEGYRKILDNYPGIKIVAKQSGNWRREEGYAIVENWIASGKVFDAVLSENDNMAMGAIQAIEEAGLGNRIKVYGVDGDKDAMKAVQEGKLAGTVFQDARAQGEGAVYTALKIINGEPVEKQILIPFKEVRKSNVEEFIILK